MSDVTARPSVERVLIPGPVGNLEGIVEFVTGDPPAVAVICHPHPQYGGTMTNKVVHTLAKSCNELGSTAVRFNYRGVGTSAGAYDAGNGETLDALAAVQWTRSRWPAAQLWLAGFSFGGAVAIKAAAQITTQRLITVAPAIQRVAVDVAGRPRAPWLIVQGDHDELVDAAEIREWAASLEPPPELVMLPGVDHFFHGRLNELRDAVLRWVREGVVE